VSWLGAQKCAKCGEPAMTVSNGVYLCATHALEQAKAQDRMKRGRE